MSPTLNASSALQYFKRGNAIEIHNRIMFDFYPGLPHVHLRWDLEVIIGSYSKLLRKVVII